MLKDEAAQLVEAESAIVLQKCRHMRLWVLVGDHKQLPATVFSEQAQRAGYRRSSFERLAGCGARCVQWGCSSSHGTCELAPLHPSSHGTPRLAPQHWVWMCCSPLRMNAVLS